MSDEDYNKYVPPELAAKPGEGYPWTDGNVYERKNIEPIPPALTPEEWAAREVHRIYSDDESDLYLHYGRVGLPESFAALIALANAALPDDSPYKITWADVDALEADLRTPRNYNSALGDVERTAVHNRLATLLALKFKLASYLPPRDNSTLA